MTGGNRNDVTQLIPLLDAVPPVRDRAGHPRRAPDALFAYRGYDHDTYRDQVRDRGILPANAHRGTRHGNQAGMTYDEKIRPVTAGPQATLVKIADNAHNSHPGRAAQPPADKREAPRSEVPLRARRAVASREPERC